MWVLMPAASRSSPGWSPSSVLEPEPESPGGNRAEEREVVGLPADRGARPRRAARADAGAMAVVDDLLDERRVRVRRDLRLLAREVHRRDLACRREHPDRAAPEGHRRADERLVLREHRDERPVLADAGVAGARRIRAEVQQHRDRRAADLVIADGADHGRRVADLAAMPGGADLV